MGCCGDREKGLANVAADQKWDYIVCSACGSQRSPRKSCTDVLRTSQTSGPRPA
jgi:hypothetical protein